MLNKYITRGGVPLPAVNGYGGKKIFFVWFLLYLMASSLTVSGQNSPFALGSATEPLSSAFVTTDKFREVVLLRGRLLLFKLSTKGMTLMVLMKNTINPGILWLR
jgi:hypothetical protein